MGPGAPRTVPALGEYTLRLRIDSRCVALVGLPRMRCARKIVGAGMLAACLAKALPLRAQPWGDQTELGRRRVGEDERIKDFQRRSRELDRLVEIQEALSLVAKVDGELSGAAVLGAGIAVGGDAERIYFVTANHVVRHG